MLQSVSNCRL
ncbi:hypothetical protein OYC64_009940 [Pagothenia borchgrevinki]|uniref:Uncharacterized protein n=1 Tax=Pagothenia borchgrevinki TaxID=8213 RepID=A0ABD2H7H9_PAGBO